MQEINHKIAPEQYELQEKPAYAFGIDRRSFFKILGSGLAVAFSAGRSFGIETTAAPEDQVNAWIHISEKGLITVYSGKAEVGQNIRTSLAQIVAEELNVGIDKISMVLGDTALTPYDRGTFGSRSIPYMGPQLRKAAATARELLIDMAAKKFGVDRGKLAAENGVIHSVDRKHSVSIGELARGKELLHPVNGKAAVTPLNKWKVAGTSVKKVNGESFITGRHKYTSDMKLPGMLYGKVLRAPAYGAVLEKADTSKAKQIQGVIVVEDREFIGVAAPTLFLANRALKAIDASWKTEPQPSRAEIFAWLKDKADGQNSSNRSVMEAFRQSSHQVEKTILVDYIAHAPLEPRAGLAKWDGDNLTVWTGTQRPFGVQEDLADVFNMSKEKIRVIQPDTGSGYGGKHTGEAGIEAARLAKACGKPVKVVWTREEEFTWAYFRPAGVIEVKASVDNAGMLTSWEFHNYNSGGSGIETPYAAREKHIKFHPSDSPLRQGSYRGLAATANVFARESIMDDLAAAVKMDPLTFRLQNLKEPRMQAVLKAAADKFGWSSFKSKPGSGIGIACGTEKASFVATCAEVEVNDDGKPTIKRVAVAFECGAIINPEHLKNQVVGCVIQGLGGALFERVDFKNGKILNPSFSRYRVPRFSDIPPIDVVLVNRTDIPSAGAGETPIIGIAPAVRNAYASASGKRLYSLPLFDPSNE